MISALPNGSAPIAEMLEAASFVPARPRWGLVSMSTIPQAPVGVIPGVVFAPLLACDGALPSVAEMSAEQIGALHLATMQLRQRAVEKCNAIAEIYSAEIVRRINAADRGRGVCA